MGAEFSGVNNYPTHVSDSEDEHEYGIPLHDAIFDNDYHTINQLITNGDNVDVRNSRDETALFVAVTKANVESVKLLLFNSAEPNLADEYGVTPLLKAVKCCHEDIVEILLEGNADPDLADSTRWSPLHEACYRDLPLLVEQLIRIGSADVNVLTTDCNMTPLFTACQYGSNKCAEVLLANGADSSKTTVHGDTPLHIACQQGQLQCIDLLVRNGLDVDFRNELGMSPLSVCCQHERYECARKLIHYGAKIVPSDEFVVTDSPLHMAACQMETDCLQLLVDSMQERGLDVDTLYNDITALSLAVLNRNRGASCRVLLSAGANPNSVSKYEDSLTTPLLLAAENDRLDVLVALIESGGDINHATYTSPLIGATRALSTDCMEYLINHPATDINLVDSENMTALSAICSHLCSCSPKPKGYLHVETEPFKLCRKMLRAGADVSRLYTTDVYSDVMDLALISNHPDLMQLLLAFDGSRLATKRICEANSKEKLWKPLFEIARSPMPLKHLCRLEIRQTLGQWGLRQINSLPLPTLLNDYVDYKYVTL